MTARQIEKALNRFTVQFEEQCAKGYKLDNKQTFAEYAEYVIQLKERSGVKHNTIYSQYLLAVSFLCPIRFFSRTDSMNCESF